MIYLKTREEIELIRTSCLLAGKIVAQVAHTIRPGVTTQEISRLTKAFIQKNKGGSAFREPRQFAHALALSVNDTVASGVSDGYTIQDGDIITVNCRVMRNGWYGGSCYTFLTQGVSDEKKQLCKTAFDTLYAAMENVKEGYFTGAIENRIQQVVEKTGFAVVREIRGHGTGRAWHEEPDLPGTGKPFQGKKMISGMVLTLYSLVHAGTRTIYRPKNEGIRKTCDGKPSACFGHTVAVNPQKADILSTFDEIHVEIKKNRYLWQNSLQ
jgi:methionyl aminopeptidase